MIDKNLSLISEGIKSEANKFWSAKRIHAVDKALREALEKLGVKIDDNSTPDDIKLRMKIAGIRIIHFVHEDMEYTGEPIDDDGWYIYKRDNNGKMQLALKLSEPIEDENGRIKIIWEYKGE